jgi:small conductance mechanosensitive channel
MFATILRSGDNREVIIPNSQIYGGTIVNYSANETRRIDLVFGIGYDDDIAKAKQTLARVATAQQ